MLHRETVSSELLALLEALSHSNRWMALRSIPYFADADQQPTPAMHIDISWEEVKTTIQHAVNQISGF